MPVDPHIDRRAYEHRLRANGFTPGGFGQGGFVVGQHGHRRPEGGHGVERRTEAADRPNTLAVLALALAFFCPLAGVVLGTIAKRQISESGERGGGMALTGVIIGALLVVAMIVAATYLVVAFHEMAQALAARPPSAG